MPTDDPTLPLTGERTVPGVSSENYWFRRHEAAYRWALPMVSGHTVLEVGCGEGYGAALLATTATRVVGLDYDPTTVVHADQTYPQVRFVRGNLAALPLHTAAVDVLVTLQVIEHVWDHRQFLTECRRVLRPTGRLLVTTPNRLTFSPGLDRPVNPFHTWEFTADELVDLLDTCGFRPELVAGVHTGQALVALDRRHGGSFVAAQLATDPSSWSRRLADDVAGVQTSDFTIGDATRDALDLVVVARPARSST